MNKQLRLRALQIQTQLVDYGLKITKHVMIPGGIKIEVAPDHIALFKYSGAETKGRLVAFEIKDNLVTSYAICNRSKVYKWRVTNLSEVLDLSEFKKE